MKKKKYKTDVVSFFKKEILTTRILVDNIRKKSWKESITIANLYGQKKFKPATTKANKSLHSDTRSGLVSLLPLQSKTKP